MPVAIRKPSNRAKRVRFFLHIVKGTKHVGLSARKVYAQSVKMREGAHSRRVSSSL